jgi:hypothetical protein
MEPDGRLLFTILIRRNRLSALFTGAEAFHALRGFLLYE